MNIYLIMKKAKDNGSRYTKMSVLVRDLNKGSEAAFDHLFVTYYKPLCYYAFGILGDYDAVEDVVQDVFSVVWQKCVKIKEGYSLDAYLKTAVRNKCIDRIKEKHKENYAIGQLNLETEIDDEQFDADIRKMLLYIEKLPPQRRAIFKMVVIDGLKYQEAADRLNLSLNTVKTQMKLAYKTLRN